MLEFADKVSGIYFVQLVNENGTIFRLKAIKEKETI